MRLFGWEPIIPSVNKFFSITPKNLGEHYWHDGVPQGLILYRWLWFNWSNWRHSNEKA